MKTPLRLILLSLLIMVWGVTHFISAQEDSSENACYTGGVWEGRCDWPTDAEDAWAWNCGWYYAGVIAGRITPEAYPSTCTVITGCQPIADVYYVDSSALSGTVAAPGVLSNDLNRAECALLSFSSPTVVEGGEVTALLLSSDGSITYTVSAPSVFQFSYTTLSGASAIVTVHHGL